MRKRDFIKYPKPAVQDAGVCFGVGVVKKVKNQPKIQFVENHSNGFEDWTRDKSNIGKKLDIDIEKYQKLSDKEKSNFLEINKKENLMNLRNIKEKFEHESENLSECKFTQEKISLGKGIAHLKKAECKIKGDRKK